MKKIKEYTEFFTFDDRLDVRLIYEENKIIGFALNYRSYINEKWHQIYRVDTAHGYLHAQKFWMSVKPIAIRRFEGYDMGAVVKYFIDIIKENWLNYKRLYIIKLK